MPEEAVPSFRKLLALGRTAVKEMKMERDGKTLLMTLDNAEGLVNLPQRCLFPLAPWHWRHGRDGRAIYREPVSLA